MQIQKIIVCGSGTMGSGIAQIAARFGQETYLYDPSPDALKAAETKILDAFRAMVAKQRMNEQEMKDSLGRLQFLPHPPSVKADLIIEAIIEDLDAKIRLFQSLGEHCHRETILASNTSSLSINALQDALPNPGKVAGMHFFNPAPVMKLVEVVSGKKTEKKVSEALEALAVLWKKVPVSCTDAPGFIVNRVARHYYLEALRIVEEEGAEFEVIDRIAESSGFRMGPFRLMDLIGNDINLAVSRSLFEASDKTPRFQPSRIQEETVAKGELGRKTGKGYYTY